MCIRDRGEYLVAREELWRGVVRLPVRRRGYLTDQASKVAGGSAGVAQSREDVGAQPEHPLATTGQNPVGPILIRPPEQRERADGRG
eukprot:2782223-Alexandrium_andersonii.AAC.1